MNLYFNHPVTRTLTDTSFQLSTLSEFGLADRHLNEMVKFDTVMSMHLLN